MITIQHHRGSYDVRSVRRADLFEAWPSDTFTITDENVARQVTPPGPVLVLPAGEETKSLEHFGQCLSWLAASGASRRSTVVALGGGVIGDLVGFVASAYMRGVRLLQIPTTLLSQVDSSVGGKVAVDLPEGKNLVGAFLPPSEVRICVDLLGSLPDRQFINGMAEVWKYGLIMDRPLFHTLKVEPLSLQSLLLEEVVFRCIKLKGRVVQEDEFETTGLRAILNFGHTIGHAIETLTGYGPVLHGEAISIGMVLEARLGEALGITAPGTALEVESALSQFGLPTQHPVTRQVDEMLHAMRRDKKAHQGRLAFSLLREIGECRLVEDVDAEAVRTVLVNS